MYSPNELFGESREIVAIREKVDHLVTHARRAGRLPPILIQGETGTGKGLLAHLIHRAGPRHARPFVDVNCAAIPETLIEAELFGFERGAFTDARQAKAGLFQVAHNGTMFLDEIGLLSEGLQGKLLKVVEEQAVRRLGGTRSEPVDVWIVTASSEDLATAAKMRRFRSDLYHRLSVVTLELPPLRARRDDILLLAEHFLSRASVEYGLAQKTLGSDARAALLDYPWPGNIRELHNVIERVALLTEDAVVTASTLGLTDAAAVGPGTPEPEGRERPLGRMIEDIEQARVLEALHQTEWNVSRAATRLRISRDKLRYRIEKYGLRPPTSASPGLRKRSRVAAPPGSMPALSDTPRRRTPIQWTHQQLAALRVGFVGDPDKWTDFSRPLEFLVEKVRDFGGRVEELNPLGVVAIFGIGRGGDAVPHAAFAALAIQQAAARAVPTDFPRITGKAGIHTGRFLVGHESGSLQIAMDSKHEAWAVLETLMSRAEPGTAVVSGEAAAFLDRRFVLLPLDPAGRDEGRAFQLMARKGTEVWGRLTTFVGRRDELALLHSRLSLVVRTQGQAVGIVGEPGIGKSRLLFEFRESLTADASARYVQAHCFSFGSNTPYLPIIETLRTVCGLSDSDTATLAAEKVRTTLEEIGLAAEPGGPYLLDLLGIGESHGPLAALSSDAIRARTFEILRQIFFGLSRHQPLIFAVEDLQWIDQTSEEFLTTLADDLPSARILFIATYRAGYRPRWVEKSYTTQMALPPLSSDEGQRLLESVLPPDQVRRTLAPVILAKAEGNPFFLEELARIIARDTGGQAVVVPDTIQDVLMARIDLLPTEPKKLLQIASVCGREAPLLLLTEVWNGPGVLDSHLRELVRREFVHVRGGAGTAVCVFRHILTQEVAYRSLSDETRRRHHERVAQALSSRFLHIVDTQPELLARHFTAAGLGGRAIAYWLRAGQQARGRSAYTEAISHLTRGLEVLATFPAGSERSEREIEFQVALGASLGPVKGFGSPEVAQAYTRAQHLCQEVGQSARLFNALSGLQALYFVRAELRRAQELADQCITLAATVRDPSLVCRSSNAMGGALVHLGDPASAREYLQRAITLVDAESNRPSPHRSSVFHPLVYALSYDSWALWLLGYPDQALRANQAVLTAAARIDHPHSGALALHYANVLRQLRQEADAIPAQAEALTALSTEHGFPQFNGLALVMHGWAAAERGETREGQAAIRRGLAAYRETGSELGRPYFLGLLAEAHARAGESKEALAVLVEAITVGDEQHEHVWDAELYRQKGELLLAEPVRDAREAEACFREAIAVARRQCTKSWELRVALSLGRLLVRQCRQGEAHRTLDDVYRWFSEGFDTRDLTDARTFLETLNA
jgi:DNA-binding NtrC family response regulator/predicted ATPase